jgi:hypothetical protein
VAVTVTVGSPDIVLQNIPVQVAGGFTEGVFNVNG